MRYGELKRRAGIDREEAAQVERALEEARFWAVVEPTKTPFWEVFWTKMEANYPGWQWKRQPQTGLSEFDTS